MTLAEIKFGLSGVFQIDEDNTQSWTVSGIMVEHAPGDADGGVTAYGEQLVPNKEHQSGIGWNYIPLEGATNIPPGASVDLIINGMSVSINHHQEPTEIEFKRIGPLLTEGNV